MLVLDKTNFETEVLQGEGYIFVDFFGDGCAPCEALMPHVEKLAEKYGDKLKSVIEHTDETNPHFHFYIVQDVGEVFDLVHDGKKAALEVR